MIARVAKKKIYLRLKNVTRDILNRGLLSGTNLTLVHFPIFCSGQYE